MSAQSDPAAASALPVDPSDQGPDLTACDREPIHVPGAIQPHGLLLVADPASGRVKGGAGALEARLAPDWMGRSLAGLIGAELAARCADVAEARVPLGRLQGIGETFEVTALRVAGELVVELEPVGAHDPGAGEILTWLDQAGSSFERATDLKELCARAAASFRELLGFDRVMIYRFLDDDAGVVVAEDRDPAQGSFLNHHFPASDIPRQARALYVRNRVRVIPDAAYVPAPLRPASAGLAGLDLSDVDLRSVSPVHLQYLRHMGVAASASVSIVKDGVLWGLVACHHSQAKTIPASVRLAARTLASGLARQVKAKEDAESYRDRIRLRSAEDAALGRMAGDATWGDMFAAAGDELRRMLGADGFVVIQGDDLLCAGRTPAAADVREVGEWVRNRPTAAPFSTDRLPELFAPARDYAELCSGVLSVTLSTEEPTILLWFRAERIQVVDWAGNPHKAVAVEPGAVLTPRASFALWSEQVRGRAEPWSLSEVEAALRLRRSLFEARQNRRVRELNRELTATVADKEALLVQKDYLLKEVNHRVQNSLQLVSAFLALQARTIGSPELSAQLDEAQRRLSAVALVHRRLYSDDTVETVDLARYIEDLCGEMKTSMGQDWASHLTLDLAPILISADRAVNVGLILTELVINAGKYAYGGAAGPVSVGLEQHRARFRLIVADRGAGKNSGRQGFGTRMLNAMIGQLGGGLEEGDNRPGHRVIVTAPISPAK